MLLHITVSIIHSISSRITPGLIDWWLLILKITVFIDVLGVSGLWTSLQFLRLILPVPVLLKHSQEINLVLDDSLVILHLIQWLGVKVYDRLWELYHFLFDDVSSSVLLGRYPL